MSRILRAARHIGKEGEKYRFELALHRVELKTDEDKDIRVEWIRGPKRSATRQKATLSKETGTCSMQERLVLVATLFRGGEKGGGKQPQDKHQHQDKQDKYMPKEAVIQVISTSKKDRGRTAVLGEYRFDLSEYAPVPPPRVIQPPAEKHEQHEEGGGETANDAASPNASNPFPASSTVALAQPTVKEVSVPLAKCRDKDAQLHFTIGCVHLGATDHDDSMSLLSGMSNVDLGASGSEVNLNISGSGGGSPVSPSFSFKGGYGHSPSFGLDSPRAQQQQEANKRLPPVIEETSPSDGSFLQPPVAVSRPKDSSVSDTPDRPSLSPSSVVSFAKAQTGNFEKKEPTQQAASGWDGSMIEQKPIYQQRGKEGGEVEVSIFLQRIKDLEHQLASAYEEMAKAKEAHSKELSRYETELDKARKQLKQDEAAHKQLIAEKDERIRELAHQLDEMKVDRREKENLDSNLSISQKSAVSVVADVLRDELKTTKHKLERAEMEISEREEQSSRLRQDFEKRIEELQASLSALRRSSELRQTMLEKRAQETEDDRARIEQERDEFEKKCRALEKDLSRLRLAISSQDHTQEGLGQQVQVLQQEVSELTAVRDALRREREADMATHRAEKRVLKDEAVGYRRKNELEVTTLQRETKALKDRLQELEQELADRPRPSTMAKLETMSRDNEMQQRNLAARILELEEELINTKVELANSETERDRQMDRVRARFETTREQLRTYATLVADLEVRLVDLQAEHSSQEKPKKTSFFRFWGS
ncbi:unnamed protein product [Vitrella brassicaformis CCMP3155]|uniref:C2 NT-type domain-containing protein n=1 Tax=Vitrella brassicaformis (strain CCMP3155) TaxID=1169540 RepID=A0A0G4EM11_VITBC|nr:unnamed protein product [Vitrella brassicaformis CCMP3155]|mmetsp:Transcript_42077/g.105088  ORF Transcript_42077/g.105088 Transcript_42077/m.105088 type:complete len:766 (-) Transcript_42077:1874-4171(-)|eukprot:CEL98172.1 unnamed protein product [Vitrella brassicaformis CCMP3155]